MESINERSYGIVPIEMRKGVPFVFLIQHYSGAWLLPKGRPESGETKQQTAERELFEETGLRVVRYLVETPLVEQYQFFRAHRRIHKEATYFVATVSGEVSLQASEVKSGAWHPLIEAPHHVSFSEMQHLLHRVISLFDGGNCLVNDEEKSTNFLGGASRPS